MARLFISHSSRNDMAIQVRDWLAANGWDDVFLDPERGIVAGQRWKEALQKAAYPCEAVLALVSAEWLASGWCKSEIDDARLIGKKVIVVLVGIDESQVPPQAYRRLKEGLKRAGLGASMRSVGLCALALIGRTISSSISNPNVEGSIPYG
jgi:TIR domain